MEEWPAGVHSVVSSNVKKLDTSVSDRHFRVMKSSRASIGSIMKIERNTLIAEGFVLTELASE